jgi:hypothetical protein
VVDEPFHQQRWHDADHGRGHDSEQVHAEQHPVGGDEAGYPAQRGPADLRLAQLVGIHSAWSEVLQSAPKGEFCNEVIKVTPLASLPFPLRR